MTSYILEKLEIYVICERWHVLVGGTFLYDCRMNRSTPKLSTYSKNEAGDKEIGIR